MTSPEHADAKRKAGHATQARQGAHIGTAERIKKACWFEARSHEELVRELELPESVVKSSVERMLGLNGGGLIAIGARGKLRFATFGGPAARNAERKDVQPFAIAGSRAQIEDRPLARDPFAHMKLCLATRR